ncbi:hypothetical protein ACLBR5_16590 [Escherichia coli]
MHPVTRTIDRIESFFGELGFTVEPGRKSKTIIITSMLEHSWSPPGAR